MAWATFHQSDLVPDGRVTCVPTSCQCRFSVLKGHMSAQLQSHNHDTVTAVQKLVCLAIQESSLNVPHTLLRGGCTHIHTHTCMRSV